MTFEKHITQTLAVLQSLTIDRDVFWGWIRCRHASGQMHFF